MKIASLKLFYFSLASFIIALLTGIEFHRIAAASATRDFDFGVPLVYGLIILQCGISLAGIVGSLKSRSRGAQ
jgi:hypothetical protein